MRAAAPILLVVLTAAVGGRAVAQSNAERMANDHYTRSHDYDLVAPADRGPEFDWDSTSFDGRA